MDTLGAPLDQFFFYQGYVTFRQGHNIVLFVLCEIHFFSVKENRNLPRLADLCKQKLAETCRFIFGRLRHRVTSNRDLKRLSVRCVRTSHTLEAPLDQIFYQGYVTFRQGHNIVLNLFCVNIVLFVLCEIHFFSIKKQKLAKTRIFIKTETC